MWSSYPKKIKINIAVFLLIVLVMPVSINLALNQARYLSRASNSKPPTVVISIDKPLSPTSATTPRLLVVNKDYTLPIVINTNGFKVTGANIELTYDPSKIQVKSVTKGDFLTDVLTPPIIENGKIAFTFVVPPDSGGKLGSGTIANLNIKPLETGKSQISFSDNTKVAAIGSPDNVLKKARNIILIITNDNIVPLTCFSICQNNNECPNNLKCLPWKLTDEDGVQTLRCLNKTCPNQKSCTCPSPFPTMRPNKSNQ